MAISNDKEFKAKLGDLSLSQQRQVAARFVRRVFGLSNDVRVKTAMEVAMRPEKSSDAELTMVCAAANSARVESFTQCGKETDWNAQAGHFVAKAAVACVGAASPTLAWDAAMQARMARICETVATGEGTQNREAEEQYRVLEDFLK